MREEQYRHLVRLAWSLNKRGLRAVVDLPLKSDPVLLLPRTGSPLRVMALARRGTWTFTWGRGRDQRVAAPADEAADRIWEVAQ
ncbi:hypothetical protein [Sphaerisporangium album]|uniref:hypothetical protein n=1 Tax=Sphaerisporangium album TaxID=509200 RepID=UPI0015F0FCA0|nr:hypothetical protein [Sphaerisporangium album]